MRTRVLFGAVGFAFVLLALYVFPPVVMETAMLPLCALATYELISSTKLVRNHALLIVSILTSVALAACSAYALPTAAFTATAALGTMLGLVCLLRFHNTMRIEQVACALLGSLLLPYLLLALIRIFHMQNGPFLVLLPLLAAWGSDTCALFAGMLFGKHKLAPVISPKKTMEGAVGGIFGGMVCVLIFTVLMAGTPGFMLPYWAAALLGAVGAVIGQIGDLSFSIIKRQTGIKDYGSIFPGHGGVLDRFDSVIFVAPFVEIILQVFAA